MNDVQIVWPSWLGTCKSDWELWRGIKMLLASIWMNPWYSDVDELGCLWRKNVAISPFKKRQPAVLGIHWIREKLIKYAKLEKKETYHRKRFGTLPMKSLHYCWIFRCCLTTRYTTFSKTGENSILANDLHFVLCYVFYWYLETRRNWHWVFITIVANVSVLLS